MPIQSAVMQASSWQCEGVPFCFDYPVIVTVAFFGAMTAVVGLIAFMKIRNYRLRRTST